MSSGTTSGSGGAPRKPRNPVPSFSFLPSRAGAPLTASASTRARAWLREKRPRRSARKTSSRIPSQTGPRRSPQGLLEVAFHRPMRKSITATVSDSPTADTTSQVASCVDRLIVFPVPNGHGAYVGLNPVLTYRYGS